MIPKLRAIADYFLGRSKTLSWRRLAIAITGTGLLLADKLDGDQWLWVAGIFVGGETLEAVAGKLRGQPCPPWRGPVSSWAWSQPERASSLASRSAPDGPSAPRLPRRSRSNRTQPGSGRRRWLF